MDTSLYKRLCERLADLAHLNSCLALLQWDQEVFMPVKGGEPRANTISYVSVLAHEKILELNKKGELRRLRAQMKAGSPNAKSIVIQEAWRVYDREQKLPAAFVKELSTLSSLSQTAWAEARKKSDLSRRHRRENT